ncbi:MAG: hypothetical protein K2P90_00760 [Holosporales bacterium]|nr:hypothetical protein [Holosporales bacterium]
MSRFLVFCLVLIQLITQPFSSGVFAGPENQENETLILTQPRKGDTRKAETPDERLAPPDAARCVYCGPKWFVDPTGATLEDIRKRQERVNHGVDLFNPICISGLLASLGAVLPNISYFAPYDFIIYPISGAVAGGGALLSCSVFCLKSCCDQLNKNREEQNILFGDL